MDARRMRKRALYPRAVAVRRSMAWPPYPRYPRRPLAPPHPAPARKSHKLFSKRVVFCPMPYNRQHFSTFGVLWQYCAVPERERSFLPLCARREQSKNSLFRADRPGLRRPSLVFSVPAAVRRGGDLLLGACDFLASASAALLVSGRFRVRFRETRTRALFF